MSHIEQAGSDTVTDPDGVQLSLPFASKDIETDPLGHQTTKRYDGLHRILSITNADSRSKRYEDELNRVTSRTDGAGNTTQFKYDGRGLLTELIEPKRDAQNNPVSRTLYEYNELGSLTKVTDANQGVWQYGYDAEQKLTSITDKVR